MYGVELYAAVRLTVVDEGFSNHEAGRDVPRKQRHTAHRIFDRLRDEHGFTDGYTILKACEHMPVRSGRTRRSRGLGDDSSR